MAQPEAAAGATGAARAAGPESPEPHPAAAAPPGGRLPLTQLLKSLLDDILGLISDRVHLVALELKRARMALAQLVGLLVGAAILAATAWFALWGLLVAAAVVYGLPWWGIGLGAILLNLLGGWLALRRVRALAEFLALPATFRRLTIAPAPQPAASGAPRSPGASLP